MSQDEKEEIRKGYEEKYIELYLESHTGSERAEAEEYVKNNLEHLFDAFEYLKMEATSEEKEKAIFLRAERMARREMRAEKEVRIVNFLDAWIQGQEELPDQSSREEVRKIIEMRLEEIIPCMMQEEGSYFDRLNRTVAIMKRERYTAQQLGRATIDAPITEKMEVAQVRTEHGAQDVTKSGGEVGDVN